MSVESAKAFLSRIVSDEAFKKSLESASDEEARIAIVKGAGYDFTRSEMETLLAAEGHGELSEEELEAVSGGSVSTTVTNVITDITSVVALVA